MTRRHNPLLLAACDFICIVCDAWHQAQNCFVPDSTLDTQRATGWICWATALRSPKLSRTKWGRMLLLESVESSVTPASRPAAAQGAVRVSGSTLVTNWAAGQQTCWSISWSAAHEHGQEYCRTKRCSATLFSTGLNWEN